MNEQIIQQINDSSDNKVGNDVNKQNQTSYLVFKMNDDFFAIESALSREILRELVVYPLPFVPSYIDGVLNRHGEPYTVIDPMLLMNKKKQTANLFLIFQIEKEQLSIRITDVIEFNQVDDSEIHSFTKADSITYFKSTFTWKDKEIPIINVFSFLDKITNDLSK